MHELFERIIYDNTVHGHDLDYLELVTRLLTAASFIDKPTCRTLRRIVDLHDPTPLSYLMDQLEVKFRDADFVVNDHTNANWKQMTFYGNIAANALREFDFIKQVEIETVKNIDHRDVRHRFREDIEGNTMITPNKGRW